METERPLTGAEVISGEEITELRGLLGEVQSHRLCVLASAAARTAERARALLKQLEWASECDDEWSCPSCGGLQPGGVNWHKEPEGHKPDCELAALIGES